MDNAYPILIAGGLLIGVFLYLKQRVNSQSKTFQKEQDDFLQKKSQDKVKEIDKLTNEMGHAVKDQKNATVLQIEDFYDKKK